MATSLTDKRIVVVGGSAGIGLGVAKHSLLNLASEVIVVSSKKSRVNAALASLGNVIAEHGLPGKVKGEVCDAGDTTAVRALFEAIGELDHIVWTAGPAQIFDLLQKDLAQYKSTPRSNTLDLTFN